jgi:hypothetical protein
MMRFYFSRHGRYLGYSTGLFFWLAAAVIAAVLVLAFGRVIFYLAPVIALWALVIWLARPYLRRLRARATGKPGTGQPR